MSRPSSKHYRHWNRPTECDVSFIVSLTIPSDCAPHQNSHSRATHVIDRAARDEMRLGRGRYPGRQQLGSQRSAGLEQAENERTSLVLQFARHSLARAGVDGERVQEIALFGRPSEELRRLADEKRVDLIIVGGRPGKPGPHSLGKTARFLIDHAQRAILMVRQDG
jgi:nucleotide-binding universal stress UspA family protein